MSRIYSGFFIAIRPAATRRKPAPEQRIPVGEKIPDANPAMIRIIPSITEVLAIRAGVSLGRVAGIVPRCWSNRYMKCTHHVPGRVPQRQFEGQFREKIPGRHPRHDG